MWAVHVCALTTKAVSMLENMTQFDTCGGKDGLLLSSLPWKEDEEWLGHDHSVCYTTEYTPKYCTCM